MTDYVTHQARLNIPAIAPAIYEAMAGFDRVPSGGVDHSLVELVKLRASQLNGCAYCVDMHVRDATKAGEDDRRLHTVAVWRNRLAVSTRTQPSSTVRA